MTRRLGDDRGSVTIWALAMVLVVFTFGWLTWDLYAGFSVRRDLASAADQAAQAGAAALDEEAWRTTGVAQLDPARAEGLAGDSLARHDLAGLSRVSISASTEQITVSLEGVSDSKLLALFDNGGPLHVRVTAVGVPEEPTP